MLGPVETVDEIDSTNAELLRRARQGAPGGLVLVARHQTAGRGRRDRRWDAPAGASLLVSVLLRPQLAIDDVHLVGMAAGLAAVDACAEVTGASVALKWPNDVVTAEAVPRKVAGLLAETVVSAGTLDALVLGMGLNVNWVGEVPANGVALNQLVGQPVDGDLLLRRWLASFEALVARLPSPRGRRHVRDSYRRSCTTIGRTVQVDTGTEVVRGQAVGVDDAGHLLVACPDVRAFAVGDVVHVRPGGT